MSGNRIGKLFSLTSFGESHGEAVGGVIDGCPSGIILDYMFINAEMARRKASGVSYTTTRIEEDNVEFLSGIFEGKTLGTPIAFIIKNKAHQSSDYQNISNVFRPSHADFVYQQKYGIRDARGGGRSSARETAVRVAAGAIAKLFLQKHGIEIFSYVSAVGDIKVDKTKEYKYSDINSSEIFCPDKEKETQMLQLLKSLKDEGDSIGAEIHTIVKGVPVGLGEPVFDKLQADLAKAMMSINAAKGFEYGEGFSSVQLKGSENNDSFVVSNNKISTLTNHSGGIQGGLSNGMDIYFSVAFKPIASISKSQTTVDSELNSVEVSVPGRHDVCVAPRVVPVVEAMTALILADHFLRYNAYKNFES